MSTRALRSLCACSLLLSVAAAWEQCGRQSTFETSISLVGHYTQLQYPQQTDRRWEGQQRRFILRQASYYGRAQHKIEPIGRKDGLTSHASSDYTCLLSGNLVNPFSILFFNKLELNISMCLLIFVVVFFQFSERVDQNNREKTIFWKLICEN